LGTVAPQTPAAYRQGAEVLVQDGYLRSVEAAREHQAARV
jgi:hypothetical protein